MTKTRNSSGINWLELASLVDLQLLLDKDRKAAVAAEEVATKQLEYEELSRMIAAANVPAVAALLQLQADKIQEEIRAEQAENERKMKKSTKSFCCIISWEK